MNADLSAHGFPLSRRKLLAATAVGAASVFAGREGTAQASPAPTSAPGVASGAGPTPGFAYQGPPRYGPTGMPTYGAWTHTFIGAGGYVTGIHTTPANPDVVYLRNDASGTYRSDDRGAYWYMVDDGQPARSLSIDPRDAQTLVLVKQDGIYHSTRVTAQYRDPDLTLEDVWSHPVERRNFAETNGTFRGRGSVIDRDPTKPDVLVAGTLADAGGQPCLYRSTDGGATWTLLATSPAGIQTADVHFDPHHPGTVYVVSQPQDRSSSRTFVPGLWRSTDRGDTWTKLTQEYPSEFRFDPDHADVLYGYFDPDIGMGVGPTVKRSTDGGRTWAPFMAGLPQTSFQLIETRPGEVLLFSGEPDYGVSIWRLPAGGSTWEAYSDGNQSTVDDDAWWEETRRPTIDDVSAVAFNPADPDEWYLTSTYATYRSTDAGRHWTYSSMGLEEMVTMEVVQDPAPGSDLVHAATADWMYFRLGDQGERYEFHRYPDIHILNTLAVSPADPNRIYAASANYNTEPPVGRICISTDKGVTWTSVDAAKGGLPAVELNDSLAWYEDFYGPSDGDPNPVSPAVMGLAAHPRDAEYVVAAIGGTYEQYTGTSWGGFPEGTGRQGGVGVYRSTDGGATWQELPGTLTGSVPAQTFSYNDPLAMSGDGTIVLAPWYDGPLQCWDARTGEWFVPEVDFGGEAYQVTADPRTDGRFLVAISSGQGGAWETLDGGRTWRKLVDARVNAVAYDAHHPERIAVALEDEPHVLYSDDRGTTFEALERINDQNFAFNMAFVRDRLVVGPGGSSYFFTDLPVLVDVEVTSTVRGDGHGLVEVVVRRRNGFDPTTSVDVASLRFGAADYATGTRGARPVGRGRVRDGSLVLRFRVDGTRFRTGEQTARLVGETRDGTPLLGTTTVHVK
ncbi:VPS10 domain-containing protein [Actinopolymorpha pittospori]